MFDPSILPPLPPMAKQLPPMAKQPPWVPLGTKDCSQGFCSIYCPQWCYIVFSPPPPFFFDDDDEDDNSSGSPTLSPLVIIIIGILASAFLLISYYAIVSKFRGGGSGCGGSFLRRRQQQHQHRRDDGLDDDNEDAVLRRSRRDEEWHIPPTVGIDEALIHKITVCEYKRGDGLVGCSDCSVCLGEFREGESLRLLPKCSHAFHVQCIDTWLKSHSNCPLCRANILLVSPAPTPQLPDPEATQPEGVRDIDETAVATGGPAGGTSSEGGSDRPSKEFEVIEMGEDDSQRMRRSFSMDYFHQGRVSVADILRVDMEEAEDGEIVVVGSSSRRRSRGEHSKGSSSLHCDSPVAAIKRSLSSGRFCLTRQGRGRGSSLLLPI